MKVDDEEEKLYYDTYQPEELEEINMKEQKMKKLHPILIIVDDSADDPKKLLDIVSYYTDWQREVGTMQLVFV